MEDVDTPIDPILNPDFDPNVDNGVERRIGAPMIAVLGALHDDIAAGNGDDQVRRMAKRARNRVAKALAGLAKAEFGMLEPTVANEAVVRSFLVREAKARHVRSTDLLGVITYALLFYHIPSAIEREATHIQGSVEYTSAANEWRVIN